MEICHYYKIFKFHTRSWCMRLLTKIHWIIRNKFATFYFCKYNENTGNLWVKQIQNKAKQKIKYLNYKVNYYRLKSDRSINVINNNMHIKLCICECGVSLCVVHSRLAFAQFTVNDAVIIMLNIYYWTHHTIFNFHVYMYNIHLNTQRDMHVVLLIDSLSCNPNHQFYFFFFWFNNISIMIIIIIIMDRLQMVWEKEISECYYFNTFLRFFI